MYKAILVDDEITLRNAIEAKLPWNDLGFELITACQNGKEVISVLEKQPVDLIITDICMPHMDGLELSEYVSEHFPQTRIVIISGYDDFEYAKKAMTYHVEEYLLKPVTLAELSSVIEKIHTSLDKSNQEQELLHRMQHAYDENLPTLKNRFLAGLLSSNPVSASYISEKLEEFKLQLNGPNYICTIINPLSSTNASFPDGLSAFSIYSTSKDIVHSLSAGEAFLSSANHTILIFSAPTQPEVISLSDTVCREIMELTTHLMDIELNISIGKPVYSLHKLPISYQSALTVLENFFLFGSNQILSYRDLSPSMPDIDINRAEWINKILELMKSGTTTELDFILEQFINTLRKGHCPKPRVILHVQSLVLSIMNFLENTVFYSDQLLCAEQKLFDLLTNALHLSEIEQELKSFCHEVYSSIHEKNTDYNEKQAMLALDFIDSHYQDCDLNLNTICQHLSMSTSRFSSIFKNYTGETFIEALTRVRMEHAKELIALSTLKTYEIAEQCGYADSHYFSIAFKKYTKITPTEYAKSLKDE